MTKLLEMRIRKYGIVDTRNYRYVYTETRDHSAMEIVCIPLYMLSTTDALVLSNWKRVKLYA